MVLWFLLKIYFSAYWFFMFNFLWKRKRQRLFICWFISQMSPTIRAQLNWIREPRPQCGSPIWVVGAQTLRPSFAAFPWLPGGSWIRSGASRTQTSTHEGYQHHTQQLHWLYYSTSPSTSQFWAEVLDTTFWAKHLTSSVEISCAFFKWWPEILEMVMIPSA